MSWRLAPLGDLCEVSTGQSAPQDADAFSGIGRPFIRAGSLDHLVSGGSEDDLEKISEENARRFRMRLFPAGTIVFAKSGMSATLGRVYRLRSPCYVVSHLAALIPGSQLDGDFLLRWLEANPPSRLIANDAYPSIKTSEISNVRFPAAEITEQRRIASVLDKADGIRKKRREAIKLADEFIRSAFVDLCQSKPNLTSLSDIADIITGFAFQSESYTSEPSDIRLVRGTNVGTGQFDWSETAFYPRSLTSHLEKFSIRAGDVLLAMDRPWISSGLKCCVADTTIEGNLLVQRVARIRPHREMDSEFIFRCMNSHQFIRHCRVTETTIPHISPRDLTSFPVPDIDNSEKERFGKIAWRAREMTGRMSLQLAEANQAFNALSHRAFSGQL